MVNELSYFIKDADSLFKGAKFELATVDEYELLLVDGEPLFFLVLGKPFLTVRGALTITPEQRSVLVDAGAVPFVAKGADVMRPGITFAHPDIKEGDLVVVIEETHKKPLAIGRALISGESMKGDSGKAIKTIHSVGDKLWNLQL